MKDLDISNIESKPKAPKRDRIRIERKKYDELRAEVERLKQANADKAKRLEEIAGIGLKYKQEADVLVAERDALKAENAELTAELDMANADNKRLRKQRDAAALNVSLQKAVIDTKATEHAHLDTLARNLRDQRDMARFLAAMLFIALPDLPWLFGLASWFRT